MSKLRRLDWQIHIQLDSPDPETKKKRYKVITNNFVLDELLEEELSFAVTPFVGCPGKLQIHVHECVGTESERYRIFEKTNQLMQLQRRAAGFLSPIHPALVSYWYNVSNTREKFDIGVLKGFLNGKRILFCGAGPSLEENFDVIADIIHNDKAFVITGGTGIKAFSDRGIYPHLCLAIDPFDHEFDRFEGVSRRFMKKVPLLASASLNPTCYDHWKGPLIAAEGMNCMDLGKYIEKSGEPIQEGAVGVGTWAINLAGYFECDEYITVGTDLCFGKDGQTYADDIDLEAHSYQPVEKDGKQTKTNWVLEAEEYSRTSREYGYKRFNTSGGLKIQGFKHKKLSSVLDNTSQCNAVPLIKWEDGKQDAILTRMADFMGQLSHFKDHMGDADLDGCDAFLGLIKQYDNIQEYQYWRSGFYNYSLIREVCDANVQLIDKCINKVPYAGQPDIGFKGSPAMPAEKKDKIRTGSAHKEVK